MSQAEKWIRQIIIGTLVLAAIVLAFSSVMDLWLWLTFRTLIPAWVLSAFMVGCIGLIVVLIYLIGSTTRERSTKRIRAGSRPGGKSPQRIHYRAARGSRLIL